MKKVIGFLDDLVLEKIAVSIGGLFLCLLVGGVIYVSAKLGKLDIGEIATEDTTVNENVGKLGNSYTTVALFVIDSRSDELEKGTRSDCVIIASLNNVTKEVCMISLYPVTLLDIEEGYL